MPNARSPCFPDAVLDVNDERDAFSHGLHLTLARIASLNAFLDAFFGVILTDCFSTSETLLTFGSEGNVLSGFDFVTGFLHHFQELIIVLCSDDTPVNGLLELLFPARSSFGFRVFLVIHTLALRWRNHRKSMLFADGITELPQLPVCSLIAPVRMVIAKVHSIE